MPCMRGNAPQHLQVLLRLPHAVHWGYVIGLRNADYLRSWVRPPELFVGLCLVFGAQGLWIWTLALEV